MDDKTKLKIFNQACILGFAAISVIALCDFLDKKSEKDRIDRMQPEKSVVYYSSSRVFPDLESNDTILDICEDINLSLNAVTELDGSSNNIAYCTSDTIVPVESSNFESNFEIEDTLYSESDVTYTSLEIPYGNTNVYLYMDYRTITAVDTPQYRLQELAYTNELGIREYNGCYCVAMSSRYGEVGQKLRITTDLGNVYNVIIADIKGYDSVDGWYHTTNDGRINLIEFVVDTYYLDTYAIQMGDCEVIPGIGGNIVKIETLD